MPILGSGLRVQHAYERQSVTARAQQRSDLCRPRTNEKRTACSCAGQVKLRRDGD